MKGIATLPVIVVIVVILAGFLVARSLFKENQPSPAPSGTGPSHQEESGGGYGMEKPFYSKDGVSFQHYWPGDGSFSSEETEILLLNESSTNVEVTSFALVYSVEGRPYPHKSGTWEKFPSKQSWDRIEYLNISPQYYKNEQLLLTPGQKGKLHWHIQFGPKPLDGRQNVKAKLTLYKGSETINIDEQFNRDSGTVFSKSEH